MSESFLIFDEGLKGSLKLTPNLIRLSGAPHDAQKVGRKITERPTHLVGCPSPGFVGLCILRNHL